MAAWRHGSPKGRWAIQHGTRPHLHARAVQASAQQARTARRACRHATGLLVAAGECGIGS
eukprot:365618-Chlamydomonas_euryale.AAC.2